MTTWGCSSEACSLALAPEAGNEVRVAAQLAREQLEGGLAAVLDVPGAVHRSHAASTENALDPIAADDCPRIKRHDGA